MKDEYPIFDILNEIKKYDGTDIKCGEYYVDKCFYVGPIQYQEVSITVFSFVTFWNKAI